MTAAATLVVFTFAVVLGVATADADPLQDLCVADLASGVRIDGYGCKQPATADDFYFNGLSKPGVANASFGFAVTVANVLKLPGLNTQGLSVSRLDFAPGGMNPPHTHPRASEIIFVLEGQMEVGFITTANTLYLKTLNKGDMFVFPRGLVHYQKNRQNVSASAITAFNSQLPGTQSLGGTLFAAQPSVPDDVLAQAYHMGGKAVQRVKSNFAPKPPTAPKAKTQTP